MQFNIFTIIATSLIPASLAGAKPVNLKTFAAAAISVKGLEERAGIVGGMTLAAAEPRNIISSFGQSAGHYGQFGQSAIRDSTHPIIVPAPPRDYMTNTVIKPLSNRVNYLSKSIATKIVPPSAPANSVPVNALVRPQVLPTADSSDTKALMSESLYERAKEITSENINKGMSTLRRTSTKMNEMVQDVQDLTALMAQHTTHGSLNSKISSSASGPSMGRKDTATLKRVWEIKPVQQIGNYLQSQAIKLNAEYIVEEQLRLLPKEYKDRIKTVLLDVSHPAFDILCKARYHQNPRLRQAAIGVVDTLLKNYKKMDVAISRKVFESICLAKGLPF